MRKLLYVKASPKTNSQSNTFKMSEAFLEEYKLHNPQDEITVLDLYNEDLKFLEGNHLEKMFGKDQADTDMYKYAKQFYESDRIVIAAPMWNLSFPAILKAYFDYISIPKVTFKYTEHGAVGLMADKGKKAIYFSSKGGMYSEGPGKDIEMGERYVRAILNFFGVQDIDTVAIELANILQGDALDVRVNDAIGHAKDLARKF